MLDLDALYGFGRSTCSEGRVLQGDGRAACGSGARQHGHGHRKRGRVQGGAQQVGGVGVSKIGAEQVAASLHSPALML